MKTFIALALLVALTVAEPPRYRQYQQQQRQYYIARQEETTTAASAAGAYPPSGWRPSGPAFNLPQRQSAAPDQKYGAPAAVPQQKYGPPAAPQRQYGASASPQQQYGAPAAAPQQQYGAPQQQYGAPQQQYGTPQQQYGLPEEPTTTESSSTEFEEATTVPSATESESEPVNSVNELDDEDLDEQQQQSGEYYVALPDGRLQRVRYVSRQDVEAMKYFAKIRAENVEPLRGPIYAYAPLQKLQILPAGLQLSVAPIAAVPAAVPAVDSKPEKLNAAPAKLEIEPVAQVQYQYDNPSRVVPLAGAPVSSAYTTYTSNYQVPESRYLLTVQ